MPYVKFDDLTTPPVVTIVSCWEIWKTFADFLVPRDSRNLAPCSTIVTKYKPSEKCPKRFQQSNFARLIGSGNGHNKIRRFLLVGYVCSALECALFYYLKQNCRNSRASKRKKENGRHGRMHTLGEFDGSQCGHRFIREGIELVHGTSFG